MIEHECWTETVLVATSAMRLCRSRKALPISACSAEDRGHIAAGVLAKSFDKQQNWIPRLLSDDWTIVLLASFVVMRRKSSVRGVHVQLKHCR